MPTTDTLADAFAELPPLVELCPLGTLLAADTTTDLARTRLQAALDADHISSTWIVTQLRASGAKTTKDTVGQHRSGKCRCNQS